MQEKPYQGPLSKGDLSREGKNGDVDETAAKDRHLSGSWSALSQRSHRAASNSVDRCYAVSDRVYRGPKRYRDREGWRKSLEWVILRWTQAPFPQLSLEISPISGEV